MVLDVFQLCLQITHGTRRAVGGIRTFSRDIAFQLVGQPSNSEKLNNGLMSGEINCRFGLNSEVFGIADRSLRSQEFWDSHVNHNGFVIKARIDSTTTSD